MAKGFTMHSSAQLVAKMLQAMDIDTPSERPDRLGMLFTAKPKGRESIMVHLGLEAFRAFRECALTHYAKQSQPKVWSLSGIEKLLQRVVGEVAASSDTDRASVTKSAIAEFGKDFFAPPATFLTCVPVYNLGTLSEPAKVGDVTFEACTKQLLLDRMDSIVDSSGMTIDGLSRVTEPFVLASATTRAHEAEAARLEAYRKVLDVVDLLNFFGPLVSLRGTPSPILSSEVGVPPETWHLSSTAERFTFASWLPTPRRFPLAKFCDLLARDEAIRRAVSFLTEEPLSECQRAMRTGISWAGRAAVPGRAHEAFLRYAISIESLLLPDQPTPEITYQLRLRAGTLLRDDDPHAFDELGKLYGFRSAIVHNGSTDVPDTSLAAVRHYSSALIHKMLDATELHAMSWKELGRWFETKWAVRGEVKGTG